MATNTPEDTLEAQLWRAFDIARNFHDITNATQVVLSLLLLRVLDKYTSLVGYGIGNQNITGLVLPQAARWATISAGRIPEALRDAIVAFDSQSENVELGLKGLFNSLLAVEWRRDIRGESAKALIACIDSIDIRVLDKVSIGQAVDHLLERAGDTAGLQSGEYYTPPELSSLLAQLLDPTSGAHIYDPTCGTASLLLAAGKAASTGDHPPALYGQEINETTATLARINLLLHEVTHFTILSGNTLTSPQFVEQGEVRRFDYIVSNSPFGSVLNASIKETLAQDPFGRFGFGVPRHADFVFLQHVLASISDTGRAVVVVPFGMLFRGGEEGAIRRQIVDYDYIEAVISLPSGWLAGTRLPTAILILSRHKDIRRKGKTLFVYADETRSRVRHNKGQAITIAKRIIDAVHNFRDERRFAAVVPIQSIAEQDYVLSPARYVDVLNLNSFLGGTVVWRELSQFGDVFQGTRFPQNAYKDGNLPVIRGRDLTDGRIVLDELGKVTPPANLKLVYARTGDLLVQRISTAPTVYQIPDELNGVLVSDYLYIIRLSEQYQGFAAYLVEFFNAPIGQGVLMRLAVGGAGLPTLTLSNLRECKVPIPEAGVIALLSDIAQVESMIRNRLDMAQRLRTRLFSIEDAERVQHDLLALRTETQVLAASVIQADDLDFQIRNFYPFPIAYPYRTALAVRDAAELYQESLRIAENMLAFLACIGLSVADDVELLQEPINEKLTVDALMSFWRGGISPGDWQAVLRESARLLNNRRQEPLPSQINSLWYRGRKQSNLADVFANLVKIKNDFKHDRGPRTSIAYEEQLPKLQELLMAAYRAIGFMIQYPIRLLRRVDMQWRTRQLKADVLLYQGDHPGMRHEHCTIASPLPSGKLYLEITPDHWAPLYPLISVHYCPSCEMRETYFVDRWDGEGERIVLKSFERGHTLESTPAAKEVSHDLQEWLQTRVRRE